MSAITPFLLPTEMMINDIRYSLGLSYTKDFSFNQYLGLHCALWEKESISDDIVSDILTDKPMDFYLYFPVRAYLVSLGKEDKEVFKNDLLKRRNHRFIDAFTLIACLKFTQDRDLKELLIQLLKEDSYNLAQYCSNPIVANAYIIYWGIYEGYLDKNTYLPLAEKYDNVSNDNLLVALKRAIQ